MPPEVCLNAQAATATVEGPEPAAATEVVAFHKKLPYYEETPLRSLPELAQQLGLGHVLVKDESDRFGLPSFKILGASWAVFRAVIEKLGLDVHAAMDKLQDSASLRKELGQTAESEGLSLVTCTEGNWGRAVARMANYLGIPSKIFVPSFMPETTRARVRSEGSQLIVIDGSYDDSVAAARQEAARNDKAILVMDMGWEGYESIPAWVVDGYSTMLNESDTQVHAATHGSQATHAFIPVGVGSIAEAVTQHYKSAPLGHPRRASVLTVEPTTAACLKASLKAGHIVPVETGNSIMCGMNCGTVSSTAWPTLKSGVDADITVTDSESHSAVRELEQLGLQPGPCGAATLAALRRACRDSRDLLNLTENSIVVLFCTEGKREYVVPE